MDKPSAPASQVSTPSTVEHLSSGLTREWLNNRQIVVYTVNDVHRETVDAWAEAFNSDIGNWPTDQVFRVIHDLKLADGITPYGRMRGQEMFKMHPEVTARVALILPATIINDLILLYVRTQGKGDASRIRQFFRTREAALAWLSR